MTEKESGILPNSFNAPNMHVDEIMHLVTGDEYKVLNFITRHILGWRSSFQEGKAIISLTMICDGYQAKTGKRFNGTGLSRPTIVKVLDSLVTYGLIEPIEKPTQKGQLWSLGLFPNIDALRERAASNSILMNKRMARVRKEVSGKSHLPVNDINQGELMPFTDAGKCDLRKQRHAQRQLTKTKEKEIAPANANAQTPASDTVNVSASKKDVPPINATTKTPLSPSGAKPLSPAVLLGQAFGVPPVGKRAYGKYGEVAKNLIDATIPCEEFDQYIKWSKRESKNTGDWEVTITALMNPDRMSKYVAARTAHNARTADLRSTQVVSMLEAHKNVYNPRNDPAYASRESRESVK